MKGTFSHFAARIVRNVACFSSAIQSKVEIEQDDADMIDDWGDALQLAVMNCKTL